jgi:predicted Zn-dependent peptidase
VLDTDLPRALDVLTDLVRNPVLRSNDLELERNVVLEEINTVEDTPDDQVYDLCYQTLWPEHPYGYRILGTRDSVSALSTDDLKQLHDRAYFPANCVIAAAGNLTHEQLLEELATQGWFNASTHNTSSGNAASATPHPTTPPPAVRGADARHTKDTAQTHIVFATDTVRYADPRKYALLVLGNVFGGGMSSRLFQRIREELGLAYAIYAFTSFYRDMGVAGARRGETADAGAADVVAGESHRPDVSFGDLPHLWGAVSQSGRSDSGGGGAHRKRNRGGGGGVLRSGETDGRLVRQRLKDVTELREKRHGETSRNDVTELRERR